MTMTHPTQEDDVKAILDALALGLTPGPWRLGNTDGFAAIVRNDAGDIITPTGPKTADAAYIATCYPERIARLLARLEQAERDAGRYQLLRRGQHWSVIDGIGDPLRAEVLDEAIDAHIAAIASEAGK